MTLGGGVPKVGGLSGYAEPATLRCVGSFHEQFRVPVLSAPRIPSEERCRLRVDLLQEELDELKVAIAEQDMVGVADALADLQYVLAGTVHEFGLGRRFGSLFDEVHRSNMSKACASKHEAELTVEQYAAKGVDARIELVGESYLVYRVPDGKVLKSVHYSPPELGGILEAPVHGYK